MHYGRIQVRIFCCALNHGDPECNRCLLCSIDKFLHRTRNHTREIEVGRRLNTKEFELQIIPLYPHVSFNRAIAYGNRHNLPYQPADFGTHFHFD